jgi:hypothetical protein
MLQNADSLTLIPVVNEQRGWRRSTCTRFKTHSRADKGKGAYYISAVFQNAATTRAKTAIP